MQRAIAIAIVLAIVLGIVWLGIRYFYLDRLKKGDGKGGGCALRLLLVILGLLCWSLTGCQYAKYRVEDALDCVDIGLTFSAKPRFAAYGNGLGVLSMGYANFEGRVLGVGGGKVGWLYHGEHSAGVFVLGHEQFDWDEYRTYKQWVGPLAIPLFPFYEAQPQYYPTCVHLIHAGFVGVVGNLRYVEIGDAICGFFGLDIIDDDGTEGVWPWKPEWGTER